MILLVSSLMQMVPNGFLANLQVLVNGISARMPTRQFPWFYRHFRRLAYQSVSYLRRTHYKNGIVGTAALLLHSILYWVHKLHKFFWLSAPLFPLGRSGTEECIEFSLFFISILERSNPQLASPNTKLSKNFF